MHVCVYIYIYIEREREIDIDKHIKAPPLIFRLPPNPLRYYVINNILGSTIIRYNTI